MRKYFDIYETFIIIKSAIHKYRKQEAETNRDSLRSMLPLMIHKSFKQTELWL